MYIQEAVSDSASNCRSTPRRKLIRGVNDLATCYPEIAALWDAERNELAPSELLPGSNRKVWWRCKKGHSWEAAPYTLTLAGSRCPCCAGKKVIPGETDLVTRYPEVAELWDWERNGDADPRQIMPATKKKFWWRCEHGHSWQAAAYSLTIVRSGCPHCAGRKARPGLTDLATKCPEVLPLWDLEHNSLDPEDVTPGSHKKVWWKCEKGHSWQARVFSVALDGRRCPRCAKPGPKPKK